MKSGYEMAANVLKRRDIYLKKRKERVMKLATVTVSTLALVIVCLGMKQLNNNDDGTHIESKPNPIESTSGVELNHSTEDTICTEGILSKDEILFNSMQNTNLSSDHAPRIDPDKDYEVSWNWNDLIEYYGDQLNNIYLPERVGATNENWSTTVYYDKLTGMVSWDEVELFFSNREADLTSPKFTVRASKLGLVISEVYVWPEELQLSQINGIQVKLGYGSSVKGEDMYVAYFTCDAVEYEVISTGIQENEFLNIIRSIIG